MTSYRTEHSDLASCRLARSHKQVCGGGHWTLGPPDSRLVAHPSDTSEQMRNGYDDLAHYLPFGWPYWDWENVSTELSDMIV